MPEIVRMFKCIQCGKIHGELEDAIACEAKDLQLSVTDYKSYNKLRSESKIVASIFKRQGKDYLGDHPTVKKLREFEKKHNLKPFEI